MPVAVGGLSLIAALSVATGLVRFAPLPVGWIWVRYATILLIIPSMGEEILFRGLLVPPRGQPMSPLVAIFAVTSFVLWHPLQAVTIGPPWRALFLEPRFLLVVALLGAMLVWMYRRSGTIWPGLVVHWFVVASWKLIFGGPIG